MRCSQCGRSRVEMRRDAAGIGFRCEVCDPHGLSVFLPFDVPTFRDLVGEVRRPSAIQARVARWSATYWDATGHRAVVSCVRCSAAVVTRAYTREELHEWSARRGWYAACDGCGQEVSGSVAGLASWLPEVRAARKREPRLHALPVRDVVRDGREAKVVGFGTAAGGSVVDAIFLRDTLRLVHVAGTG